MASRRPFIITAFLVLLLLLAGPPFAMVPSVSAEDGQNGPWSLPVRMDDGKHSGMSINSLRLVQAPDGSFHAVWMDERVNGTETRATFSGDDGETWSQDVRVDPLDNQARITPTTCDIEVDEDGYVYVTYTQWMLSQGWWRVRFARSDDGGSSFRAPSDVFFIVDDAIAQEHPATALSTHGALNILYLERTQTSSKLFLVRSDDGLNPLPPRVVEPGMAANEAHVQGDIAINGDNDLFVAFGYRAPGEAGIKLARMESGSGTFTITKVYTVTEDAPRSLRPRIAVDGDVVEIVFDPLTTEGRIVHIRSEDGGDTFGGASKIWAGGGANEAQTNPALAFDVLGRIHMSWTQGLVGKTRVRHSLSHDGITFTAPTPLTGGWNESEMGVRLWEDHPSIVPLEDGSVVAAFTANLNRTVGVYFTRMQNLPPMVEITSPDDGAEVRNTVYVQGVAADLGGTTGLEAVFVQVADGTPKRLPGTTEWEHSFDSTEFPDGDLNISAWASDGFVEGEKAYIVVDVDNNKPPTINVAKPENGTSYEGFVPVVGTADDLEGFGDGTMVQWRHPEDDAWTDSMGWELQTDTILDFDFLLDLSALPTGPASIEVRVTDGDKYSSVEARSFEMENKPDLVIEDSWISVDLDTPEHNDVVTISVTVKNQGAGASGLYDVEFRRFNNFEGMTTGRNLSVGEEDTLTFVWEAVKGDNTLRFIVDPQFKVAELDKDNNEGQITVTVKAPPPQEDEERDWTFIIAIIIVVAIIVLGGVLMAFKYWATAPALEEPDVQVVYEGGGMYSETSAEYTGADTSGRDMVEGPDETPPKTSVGQPEVSGDETLYPDTDSGHWKTGTLEGAEPMGTESPDRPQDIPRVEEHGAGLTQAVEEPPDLDKPSLDSKDDEQLIQDVDIRPEKTDRA
jgi:hypothetical protein